MARRDDIRPVAVSRLQWDEFFVYLCRAGLEQNVLDVSNTDECGECVVCDRIALFLSHSIPFMFSSSPRRLQLSHLGRGAAQRRELRSLVLTLLTPHRIDFRREPQCGDNLELSAADEAAIDLLRLARWRISQSVLPEDSVISKQSKLSLRLQ